MKTEDGDGQSMLFLASDLNTKRNRQSKFWVISYYTIFGPLPLPPPPINFVHAHIQHMDKVGHLAAAPGP